MFGNMKILLSILILAFTINFNASAQTVKIGLCYDLSKAYTFLQPYFYQAPSDLATLINNRGGLEGFKIELLLRDHGNEPQRGIECYERLKKEGAFIFATLSTPVSKAVLPRVMEDGNVLIQSLAGRSDAVVGDVFKWIFPIGPTYWNQAANDLHYIKQQSGGSLKDVKVAFVYIDQPFGLEPIEMLKAIAEEEQLNIEFFPFPLPGTDQSATWTRVRRMKPDWILMWGFAGMHTIAAREMQKNGLPMDRYIASNWISEKDIENMGGLGIGLKRGSPVAVDLNNPLRQEILEKVYGRGLGAGDVEATRDTYYMDGLAIYAVAFEAIRRGIILGGGTITADLIRRGYESIDDFNAGGLFTELKITGTDHGGTAKTRIEKWDGEKWIAETGWISAYEDLVWKIARKEAAKYRNKN